MPEEKEQPKQQEVEEKTQAEEVEDQMKEIEEAKAKKQAEALSKEEDSESEVEEVDQMKELEAAEAEKNSIKIFDLYDISQVKVEDPGLKRVITLKPMTMLKTHGRIRGKFAAAKINIIERLIRALCQPGHRGKKHRIMTRTTGHYTKNANVVLKAFKIIEEKTQKNPVQVLVNAIENASPKEEVTTVEYGGAKYPQAVDTSPLRRISLTLRLIVHGAYDKSFNKKTKIYQSLANEIVLASQESSDSFTFTKKTDAEKQANSAR
jgi:small subunit ribosomal protein S7